MNKKILILVVLVVVAGVYWLSTMTPSDYGTPNQEETANESESLVTITPKGPVGIATGASGEYLVDRNGLTLYANLTSQNSAGKITPSCNALCEKTWPPYLLGETEEGIGQSADPLLSKLNLFRRADGKMQYTLGTTLLYRNVNDAKTGDTNGELTSDWMIATP